MGTNGSDASQQENAPPVVPLANMKHDETVIRQLEEISQEIAKRFPLVGEAEPVVCLKEEYRNDDIFLSKIDNVALTYSRIRRVRGDGNCFYRAYAFLLFECCRQDTDLYTRTRAYLETSLKWLIDIGFPSFTTEDFYETFMDSLNEHVASGSAESLLELFNNDGLSNYLVVYVRLLVSGQLQHDSDNFIHFVDGGYTTMKEFCDKEVMPVDKEADHLQIMAITQCVNFPLRIIYVDRSPGNPTEIVFPDGSPASVTLIYRPGHYDILYE